MTFRLALYGFRGLRLLDGENGASSGSPSQVSTPGAGTASPTAPSSTPSGSPGSTSPGAPSTPGAAHSAAPTTPAAPEPYDFSSIFEGPLSDPETVVVLPPQPVQATPPVQPTQTPPVAPQVPAAQVTPQVPPVAQQAQVPQEPTQQPPAVGRQSPLFDPADPISIARALKENEAAAIDHVAQTVFALRPEELQALEADVAGTVPKLLAKVMVTTQQQVLSQLGRFVPMMIQRHQEVVQRHTASVGEFYKAWPQIEQAKHDLVVREMGAQYRQMNPNATTAKMIQDLGPFVMMRLGIPLTGQVLAPRQNAPAAAQQPFVPAGPGSVGHQTPIEPGAYDYLGGQ